MKRLYQIGAWALAALTVVCLIRSTLVQKAPTGIFIQGDRFDAGRVKAGEPIVHRVRIFNLSLQPVQVTTVSTCGCTTREVVGKVVRPLRSFTVTAHVSTNGAVGKRERFLIVAFKSPQKAWLHLTRVRFQVQ